MITSGSGDPSRVATRRLGSRRRIPSLTQGRLDWHRDWEAIEYWHYERRDGLRWFEAARQVYSDEEMATQLHPDRLTDLSISLQRLARLGFPAIWPPEG